MYGFAARLTAAPLTVFALPCAVLPRFPTLVPRPHAATPPTRLLPPMAGDRCLLAPSERVQRFSSASGAGNGGGDSAELERWLVSLFVSLEEQLAPQVGVLPRCRARASVCAIEHKEKQQKCVRVYVFVCLV